MEADMPMLQILVTAVGLTLGSLLVIIAPSLRLPPPADVRNFLTLGNGAVGDHDTAAGGGAEAADHRGREAAGDA